MFFGPFAVHMCDVERINHRDDRRISDLGGPVVTVNAKTDIERLTAQSGLVIGFGGGCIGWGLFMHRPALWDNPALPRPAGDQANLL